MRARTPLLPTLVLLALLTTASFGQLRRPGFVTIDREDRTESQLNKEEGAIYLEEMLDSEVAVRITKAGPIYANLTGERWLGNLVPEQNAVLLAVSERAYRVRARAKQGQVAGWVSKSTVQGLAPEFEENLRQFHERYVIVKELIDSNQVALGMTVDEVMLSIGPPDKRTSKITQEGRMDTLEYISYERIPQSGITYDAFGRPVTTTTYVEVPSGSVTVEFANNVVTSIEESEGIDFSINGIHRIVPGPVILF
ncbi:MAG: hypothetical protein AAGC68_13320 [Verrucomicrobiota bacterium]